MIVQPDFFDHWKTQLLISTLEDPSAPLVVLRLWAFCQQRKSWRFDDLTETALKSICRCPIKDVRTALEVCGFIKMEGKTLIVHDWEKVNSSLVRNWQNGKFGHLGGRPKENEPKITPGVYLANPKGYPNEPDKIRLDKIREEKKQAGGKNIYYESEIPQTHKVTTFLDVWYKWVDHRRMDASLPRNPDTMFRQQLLEFAQWGVEASIQALNDAIRCGYKGPHKPKQIEKKEGVQWKPEVMTLEEKMRAQK